MQTNFCGVSFFLLIPVLMSVVIPSEAFRCGTPAFARVRLQTAPTTVGGAEPRVQEFAPTAPMQGQAALPVGTERTFFAPDFRSMQQYTVSAVLRGVGRFCYVYVEDAEWERRVTPRTVATIIHAFDEATPAGQQGIYPTLTDVFGAPPDIDGNGRVILLLLNVRDAADIGGNYTAGFFSPADQGRGVRRNPGFRGLVVRSNVADMLYIDTFPLNINSETAHNVIAHELQHLIHWRHDNREAIWVDEGCADYASFLCGYTSHEHIAAFEKNPSVSLTAWPQERETLGGAMPHYGAAFLWMLYLHERYGGVETLRHIVQHSGTSMNGIITVLGERGYPVTMSTLFSDWKIANVVSDYAHVNLTLSPARVHYIRANSFSSVAMRSDKVVRDVGVPLRKPTSTLSMSTKTDVVTGFPIAVSQQTLPDFAAASLVFEWENAQMAQGVTLGFSCETPAQDWALHLIEYQDEAAYTVRELPLTHSGTGSLEFSGAVTKAILVPSLHSEMPRFSPRVATYEYSATRGANITFVSSVLPNPVLPRYWDIVAIPSEPLVGIAPTVTLMLDARPYRETQPMKVLQEGAMYRYTFHLEPGISPDAVTWEVFLGERSVFRHSHGVR